jgi:hypothetical protein
MSGNCVSCNNCGHTGWSKTKGSIWITLVLAFFFLVPAIIYEIWRRSGLGVCENCGSSSLTPSNKCESTKPSSIGDLLALFLAGVVGCVGIVVIYAVISGGASFAKSQQDLIEQCVASGLKHYQDSNQYPVLEDGRETSTYVLDVCKSTKDGLFKE